MSTPLREIERAPTIHHEDLIARLRDFYDDYYETLDDVRLEEWPSFFTEDCLYRVIPRENFERVAQEDAHLVLVLTNFGEHVPKMLRE